MPHAADPVAEKCSQGHHKPPRRFLCQQPMAPSDAPAWLFPGLSWEREDSAADLSSSESKLNQDLNSIISKTSRHWELGGTDARSPSSGGRTGREMAGAKGACCCRLRTQPAWPVFSNVERAPREGPTACPADRGPCGESRSGVHGGRTATGHHGGAERSMQTPLLQEAGALMRPGEGDDRFAS